MCGICGLIDLCPDSTSKAGEIVERMATLLTHRGPNSGGFFHADQVALGSRRLSVIDLRKGDQPISNESGSIQVVSNSEIYNFQALRTTLEDKGHMFRTETDTEIIVHAYEEYGVSCVKHFCGMFAIALWDEEGQQLFLARDRLGKKPLYYFHKQDRFAFASELKSLLQCPYVPRAIDPAAVDDYLAWGYIPDPRSILTGVYQLPPGHWLTFKLPTRSINQQSYWTLEYLPKLSISLPEATQELRRLLSEAVRVRLISDVPLGGFLSGGIDSRIVVGLMAEHSSKPVETFTIGFEEQDFSELPYARKVAQEFSTDHHEFIVRSRAAEILPDLVWYLDEPMADSSALPTFYLAQMARQHVTVVLNGDGGDELFAGYKRYAAVMAYQWYRSLPSSVRHGVIEPVLQRLPDDQSSNHLLSRARRLVVQSTRCLESQFLRWMTLFNSERRRCFYSPEFGNLIAHNRPVLNLHNSDGSLGPLDWMMCHDTLNYLPGDLLVKIDRMTMAHSLEARSPFLDHKVVEFAARLPETYKWKAFTSKRVLKLACSDLIPSSVLRRAKHGFSVPINQWFRNDLKSLAAEILFSSSARQRGLFNVKAMTSLWEQHQKREQNHGARLWALLIMELWQRRFLDTRYPSK